MRKFVIFALTANLFALGLTMPASAGDGDVSSVVVKAPYEQVKQDVADAVINRGYVIDYNARIGEMLTRTAADVGAKKTVYSNAETVQFCSAILSRKMMEADPANIAYCPYVIFYYEQADRPGEVHVGFRHLDESGSDISKASKKAINTLLREIIKEVADG